MYLITDSTHGYYVILTKGTFCAKIPNYPTYPL